MVAKRFGNDYLMIKDKDKEKDMFKEEDKDNDIDIVLVKEEYKEKDKNMFKGKDIIKDKKQDIDSSETFKSYKEGRISLGSTLKQLG